MRKEELRSLGISTTNEDSLHPFTRITKRNLPKVQTNGSVILYPFTNELPSQEIIKRDNLGKVDAFERTADLENPFLFPQNGYQLERNQTTGEYTFSVHPQLDFDLDAIRLLPDHERMTFLGQLEIMYPILTVTNNVDNKKSLKIRVGFGPNNSQLVSATPKEIGYPDFTNYPTDYNEENGRILAVVGHPKPFKQKDGLGFKHSQLVVSADIPIPSDSLRALYDDYARQVGGNLPRRSDILSIAQPRVYLKERYPLQDLL